MGQVQLDMVVFFLLFDITYWSVVSLMLTTHQYLHVVEHDQFDAKSGINEHRMKYTKRKNNEEEKNPQ